MKYRFLGRTGLKVSEIGFGAWAIGGSGYGPTCDEDSLRALESAWDAGVTFYDTADTYGHGHSENLVAKFLKTKPRDKVVLASKVGWDFYHGGARKNFDPTYIQFAIEKSLERLGVDCIDLYQLHNPKLEVLKQGGCLEALRKLKQAGKIRFIGVSIHTEEEGLYCVEQGAVDSLQLILNLIKPEMAEKVLPAAEAKGVAVVVREPLHCGILTGKYDLKHEFVKSDHRRRWVPETRALDLAKFKQAKEAIGDAVSTTRAALEFVLSYREVSTVIPGTKTSEQVLENLLASSEPQLLGETIEKLRQLTYDTKN